MFWFIPTTHRLVIGALLVVAVVAFVLFCVTLVLGRRERAQAEEELTVHATVRHAGRPEAEPSSSDE